MKRLDVLLVERGVYSSREKAKQAVESGRIEVNGKIETKPALLCEENCAISGKPFEFVSRGGYKLQKAIEEFNISLKDRICLDVGSSTGGFTDVCLKNGAKKVYAVDVGTNQLDESLKTNPKVLSLEGTNYLSLPAHKFLDANFACVDVSFISLTKLANKLFEDEIKEIVALIKPQFECGPQYAKKHKGIVKDEKMHKKIVEDVGNFFSNVGYSVCGVIPSPILGGDGNKEFLIHLKLK